VLDASDCSGKRNGHSLSPLTCCDATSLTLSSDRKVNGTGDPIISATTTKDTIWNVAEAAIEMYIFAATCDIIRLRQDAMDRLVWCNNVTYNLPRRGGFICPSVIKRVYDHIGPDKEVFPEGNPLHRWLLSRDPYRVNLYDDFPEEYQYHLIEIYGLADDPCALDAVWMPPCCQFHEHFTQEDFNNCVIRVDRNRELDG